MKIDIMIVARDTCTAKCTFKLVLLIVRVDSGKLLQ